MTTPSKTRQYAKKVIKKYKNTLKRLERPECDHGMQAVNTRTRKCISMGCQKRIDVVCACGCHDPKYSTYHGNNVLDCCNSPDKKRIQTKEEGWEEQFDQIAYEENVYGNPSFDPKGWHKCKDFIRNFLARERKEADDLLKEAASYLIEESEINLVYFPPAQQLRNAATKMEEKEDFIRRLEKYLASLKEKKGAEE